MKLNETIEEQIPFKMNEIANELKLKLKQEMYEKSTEIQKRIYDQWSVLNEVKSKLIKTNNDQEIKINQIVNERISEAKVEIKEKTDKIKEIADEQEKINKVIKDEKSELGTKINGLTNRVDQVKQEMIDIDTNNLKTTVTLEFNDVSAFFKGGSKFKESNKFYYKGLIWYLDLMKHGKSEELSTSFGICLNADENQKYENWSIEVNYEIELLNQSGENKKLAKCSRNKLMNKDNRFMCCGGSVDNESNYGNDQITVRVHLKGSELKLN